jgi:hypothetical protein
MIRRRHMIKSCFAVRCTIYDTTRTKTGPCRNPSPVTRNPLAAARRGWLVDALSGRDCVGLSDTTSGSRTHPRIARRDKSSYEEGRVDTHLSLICLAMVKNACSTLVAFLADVSRKGILSWSANSYGKRYQLWYALR